MNGNRRRAAAGLCAFFLLAASTSASQWRTAPLWGGDVRSLAFDPADPDRVLAGTSAGQVYLSEDGGRTWVLPGDRVALPGWVVSDLEFDPHAPGRVWAALWSLWGSGGTVAYSDDLGAYWHDRGQGLPGNQVYAVALAPDRPDVLFAATRRGVWRSVDGGGSWSESTAPRPEIGKVTSLLIDPREPDVLYAGTWRRAYRSDDRGASWSGIFDGMVLDSEVFALRSGASPGDLWASTCGWVYRGFDRGARWQRYNNGLEERRTQSFQVLPSGRLLAGTVAGAYTSDDQGRTWVRRSDPTLTIASIAFHPARPGRILLGTEGAGVWRSDDGGLTFGPSQTGMAGIRVTDLAADGKRVLVAVRHSGPQSGVHSLEGEDPSPDRVDLPTVLDLAIDGERVYAATEKGLWERSGQEWRLVSELGDRRIEEVVVGDGRAAVRSREGVFVRKARQFQPLEGPRTSVDELAIVHGRLWAVDGAGLFPLETAERATVPTPTPGGLLVRFGAGAAWASKEGLWTTPGDPGDSAWSKLAAGPARVLPTGDDRFPVAFLGDGGESTLYDSTGSAVPLYLPVSERDVSALLVHGQRLYLGTSGAGLLIASLVSVQ